LIGERANQLFSKASELVPYKARHTRPIAVFQGLQNQSPITAKKMKRRIIAPTPASFRGACRRARRPQAEMPSEPAAAQNERCKARSRGYQPYRCDSCVFEDHAALAFEIFADDEI
jgi:hypothetical protein